jgi:hypothetical protein
MKAKDCIKKIYKLVFTNKMGRVWLTKQNTLKKTPKEKLTQNQMTKGLFIGSWKKTCVRTCQLSTVERTAHGQPQKTARAGSVRRGLTGLRSSSALRATASAFECKSCVRTHFRILLHHFMSIFAPSVKA